MTCCSTNALIWLWSFQPCVLVFSCSPSFTMYTKLNFVFHWHVQYNFSFCLKYRLMAEGCQKTLRITIQNISCFFCGMTFQPITGVTFVLPMDKNMLWKNKNPTTMQRPSWAANFDKCHKKVYSALNEL